jgi:hypothetical protein
MNRLVALQEELRAKYPLPITLPATVPQKPLAPRPDPTSVVFGKDQGNRPFCVTMRDLFEHLTGIGGSGSGKTRFGIHVLRQVLKQSAAFILLDPEGNHPHSIFQTMLPLIEKLGVKAHILDFASPYTVGFNPLYCPPGTDPSVIGAYNLAAISVSRGDEDIDHKPSIEWDLRTVFSALADLNLTYLEAPMLLDRHDEHGLRAYAIEHVHDSYIRDNLKALHELSQDSRRKREYDQEVIGPRNRLQRLLSPPAVRMMHGQRKQHLDIARAVDNGEPILMSLSGGLKAHESATDLLGRLFIGSVLFHAPRRTSTRPCVVMIDEAPRFLSGDIPVLLAQARKRNISICAFMQWLHQAETKDGKILAALLSGTNTKVIFRQRNAEDSELLAHSNIPLDLEVPVKALIKPTVIGHRIIKLANGGTNETKTKSTNEARTKGDTYTEGKSITATHTVSTGHAVSDTDSHTTTRGHGASEGDTIGRGDGTSEGVVEVPTGEYWHPMSTGAETSGSNASNSHARSHTSSHNVSESDGTAHTETSTESESYGIGVTKSSAHSTMDALTKGTAHAIAKGTAEGFSEALEPILRGLPSAVHSKDNMLYRAGLMLRSLPAGMAYVSFVGRNGPVSSLVTVPPIFTRPLPSEEFAKLRDTLIAQSPAALPTEQAQENIVRRAEAIRQRKLSEPQKPRKTKPVIDNRSFEDEEGTWG